MNAAAKLNPPANPLRVLLVDDSPEFLSAVCRHIAVQPWAEVVATATSSAEALQRVRELTPDLVLMDIVMPDANGIETTRAIKRLPDAPHVVMLTLHDNAEYRYHARLAGADGFVVKSKINSDLPALVETLFVGPPRPDPAARENEQHDADLARMALDDSTEQLRFALETGDMGVFDSDVLTGITTWSPEHARLFDLSPEQFDGTLEGFVRRVHPDDRTGLEAALQAAQRDKSVCEHRYRVLRPDGSVRWLRSRGRYRYDADGRAVRLTGVTADVTAPTCTLLELQEKSARLDVIFSSNPQCIKFVDEQGLVRDMNPAGLALFGLADATAVIGRPAIEFVAPAYLEPVQAFHDRVFRGEAGRIEYEIVRGDGGRRRVESHVVPLTCPASGERLALSVTLDITERKQAEDQLSFLANHDLLTGLPNRLLFTDRLQQAMIDARRHGRNVGVVFLDLDRFKNINDALGHDVGDAVIIAASQRLTAAVRPSDTVARLGGDEFAIVLADMALAEDAPLVIQRVLDAFRPPIEIGERELFVSVSIGVTLYPADDLNADAEMLLRNADVAMYRAKEAGRSTCQFYTTEMTRRAHEHMALESALRHAIERRELSLHYQPIVDLASGQVRSVEALLRWQHPELGMISPARFIPIAEESGLIVPVGEWALREACTQMRAWHQAGHTGLHVAVNLSSRQFREPDLADRIRQILEETGLHGTGLEIELTESMLLSNIENTVRLMQRLDAEGVRFAVDDFGTGYSSLSYLKRFPIDVLKIDQSFVRDISSDADDAAIVRAIITMAHSLGIKVVAEGVETREQLQFLHRNDCNAMQGFVFSRPLPAADLTRLLVEGKALPPGEAFAGA